MCVVLGSCPDFRMHYPRLSPAGGPRLANSFHTPVSSSGPYAHSILETRKEDGFIRAGSFAARAVARLLPWGFGGVPCHIASRLGNWLDLARCGGRPGVSEMR